MVTKMVTPLCNAVEDTAETTIGLCGMDESSFAIGDNGMCSSGFCNLAFEMANQTTECAL